MAQTAQDIMTRDPETVAPEALLTEVAEIMRDADTGMVPVAEGGELRGIITDRDIVIRAIAEGRPPEECAAREVCTGAPATVAPGDDVGEVVRLMRDADVRRIPGAGADGPGGVRGGGPQARRPGGRGRCCAWTPPSPPCTGWRRTRG